MTILFEQSLILTEKAKLLAKTWISLITDALKTKILSV